MLQMLLAAGGPMLGTTFNPADKNAGVTLSNNNLTMSAGGATQGARSTLSKTAGKWYFEMTIGSGSGFAGVGLGNASASLSALVGSDANSVGYYSTNGNVFEGNVSQGVGATFTAADVIGVRLDFTAGTVAFYKNDALQVTVTGLPAGALFIQGCASNPRALTLNQTPIYLPGGFSLWA